MRLPPVLAALLAVVLVALPLSAVAAPPPVPRIAYVDMQRVLLEVDDAKAVKARLQKWLETRQRDLDAEQDALRKEKETLDRQTSSMTDALRQQKANELQQKVNRLTEKWEKSRAEAAERERKEMEPIQTKIEEIVAGIARREGITWVFDKRGSGVMYVDAAFDLTGEVIRTYNAARAPTPVKK